MTKEIFNGTAYTNGANIVVDRLANGKYAWVVVGFEDDTYFEGEVITALSAHSENPSDLISPDFLEFVSLYKPKNGFDGNYISTKKEALKAYKEDPLTVWSIVMQSEVNVILPGLHKEAVAYMVTAPRVNDNVAPILYEGGVECA